MKGKHSSLGGLAATATLLLLLVSSNCPAFLEAATQDDHYDLVDYLFTDYRKEVRPVGDDSNATVVFIGLSLLSVVDLDEKSQVFSAAVIIYFSWTDEWLTWTPSDVGGITKIRYPQNKLWLPDVVVTNSIESQTQLGYNDSPCKIDADGYVEWTPSEVLQTSCDMDVTYYPFDTQSCSIDMSTWVSPVDEIDLDLDTGEASVNLDRYSPSGTWELVSTSMESLPDNEGLSRVRYTIRLKRLSTFYVLNIIVPILLLSLTASGVFYLPADAGEKIGMSMTVLLSFAVYLTIISDNMPQTSLQVSILSVYLAILLGVCGLSVMMSVYILHLHHRPNNKPVGKKTLALTRNVRRILGHKDISKPEDTNKDTKKTSGLVKTRSLLDPLENCGTKSPETQNNRRNGKVAPYDNAVDTKDSYKPYINEEGKEEEKEEITWVTVSKTLDKVFFFSTSTFILLLTFVVITMLIHGGENAS